MTTTEFAFLNLEAIAPSPTNPRKHFDAAKLTELTEIIKSGGVHQPILVRPLPGSRIPETDRAAQYEIVAGERRWRASQQAGLTTIPAMVRHLTDDQVLEAQLVENLQRTDLSELEEAEGYETLMAHTGIGSDVLATKIGKSRAYVYARLKLLDLSAECKQAMRDGQIDASRALLIARIPDTALQTKALNEATRKDYQGEISSLRAFQNWLHANVMLRIDAAPFKVADANLVPQSGSCTNCPKRTGAMPDLFAEVATASGNDLCTDPACYHAKADAHHAILSEIARSRGLRVIYGKEAKEIIPKHTDSSKIDGYSPLSQRREDITTPDGHTGLTLRELLGADAPGAVLIEHPYTKELIEAVPTAEAEALLLARGLLKALAKKTKPGKNDLQAELELKKLQAQAQYDTRKAVRKAVFDATVQAVLNRSHLSEPLLKNVAILRAWLIEQVDAIETGLMAMALGYAFADEKDNARDEALRQHIRASGYATLSRAATIVMMFDDKNTPFWDTSEPLVMNAVAKELDVDIEALTKDTTAKVKADYAKKIRDVQAKIKTQAETKPGKSETKPTRNPGKRKQHLNAQEAQTAIAEAMQADPTFRPGQQVRVTNDLDRLRIKYHDYAGQIGTIKKQFDASLWAVKFNHHITKLMEASEIEVVQP